MICSQLFMLVRSKEYILERDTVVWDYHELRLPQLFGSHFTCLWLNFFLPTCIGHVLYWPTLDLCVSFSSLLCCCVWNPITVCFQIPYYLRGLRQAAMFHVLSMWCHCSFRTSNVPSDSYSISYVQSLSLSLQGSFLWRCVVGRRKWSQHCNGWKWPIPWSRWLIATSRQI